MAASRDFWDLPFDPAASVPGTWSAGQAAQLSQLIKEAAPDLTAGSELGMIVTGASAPDVALHPEYAYCIWRKPVSSTVQELYSWNGTSWQKTTALLSFSANTMPLSTLQTDAGSALKLIRYSVAGVPEAVTFADAVTAGSVGPTAFVNATIGSRYIFVSDEVTGVFSRVLFSAIMNEWVTTEAVLPAGRIKDPDREVATNDVVYATSPTGFFSSGPVIDRIANNSLPTQRLSLGGAANANKFVKVNASGDDFDYAAASSAVGSSALIAYAPAAGVVPDAFVISTAKVFSWSAAAEVDPASLITVNGSNQIAFAATGYYKLQLAVPVACGAAGPSKFRIYLRKGDGVTQSEITGTTRPGYMTNADTCQRTTCDWIINVTDIAELYDVVVYADTAGSLGFVSSHAAVNYGPSECYQQLVITKLT